MQDSPPKKPWYYGYYKGVRLDKALRFWVRKWHEDLKYNSYGLPAWVYYMILVLYFLYIFGGFVLSANESEHERAKSNMPNTAGKVTTESERAAHDTKAKLVLLRGLLMTFPAIWQVPLFLCPPLIANVKDQFEARGYKNAEMDRKRQRFEEHEAKRRSEQHAPEKNPEQYTSEHGPEQHASERGSGEHASEKSSRHHLL
ncbi:hypothetical protein EK21DRAFT_107794 [Setomelanomma holmii]|uniref:Uncharacterized protein n=1 Tax=Setomelanomma holmii TaxID=210430 RepID=A0A9P4LRS1_9PLEO|nr:hypothetical protein EK21DRAFT_107794 [Setomelanomma holmii]